MFECRIDILISQICRVAETAVRPPSSPLKKFLAIETFKAHTWLFLRSPTDDEARIFFTTNVFLPPYAAA